MTLFPEPFTLIMIEDDEGHAKLIRKNLERAVPVIVLTTTDNPREINRCYELGCNVYITKLVEYDNFTDAIRKLGLILAVVKLPNTPRKK